MAFTNRTIAHATVAASVLALAACASTPPNQNLQQAEVQVGALNQDPMIARYAPLEAERARHYLDVAQQSARKGADDTVVTHQAYLANQQAEIARQVAVGKSAQEVVSQGDASRAQALLASRTQEAQQAQAEADRLRQQLQSMQARQTDRGMMLTLGNVLFRTDSADLVPGAAAQMDQLATVLRSHPDYRVEIEGFTDSTGSDTYNLGLSQRRAETVQRALTQRGVDPSRVVARGLGESSPVASNDTSAGRQMNRRVEVVVEGPGLGRQQSSGSVPASPTTGMPPQYNNTARPQ
jgi:outer membrane protein OmpA-like peptidoglycan-associated protein